MPRVLREELAFEKSLTNLLARAHPIKDECHKHTITEPKRKQEQEPELLDQRSRSDD
jgi:hypothetical protein